MYTYPDMGPKSSTKHRFQRSKWAVDVYRSPLNLITMNFIMNEDNFSTNYWVDTQKLVKTYVQKCPAYNGEFECCSNTVGREMLRNRG